MISSCGIDLAKPVNIVNTAEIGKNSLGWETRKMISIDTEDRNPEIFRKHGVFVTPLSRKTVAIVKGKGFEQLGEIDKPALIHETEYALPQYLKKSRGEANFLQYAFNCGLLSHFTGRPKLRPMYSAKGRATFSFKVDGHGPFQVEGAQYELDQSYGDDATFFIVESKYGARTSFNIRQLYYPFRAFLPEVSPREVRNFLFVYDPNKTEYLFWEYAFKDPQDFEQIELVRTERYKVKFRKDPRGLKLYEVKPVQMNAIQANNIYFMMDIPALVFDGIDDPTQIADHLGIARRQGQYYREAMEILGFIKRRGGKSTLTEVGESYLNTAVAQRTKFFISRLVEYPPMAEIIRRILNGEKVDGSARREIIKMIYGGRISGDTISRRADCLRKFFEFIADVMGYCKVERGAISMISVRETLNGYG